METGAHARVLGVFTLAMINVAAVVSLRNLPAMAIHGLGALFFYFVAAIFFLVPTALICAELATTYHEEGGIYAWVRRAYGPKIALLAIWASWLITVAFLPALLTFIAKNAAYLVDPALGENKWFLWSSVMFILWFATYFNCKGLKSSAMISTVGVLFGTILPGIAIFLAGGYWSLTHGVAFEVSTSAIVPPLELGILAYMVSVFLSFEGMEITAFHAREVINPQKNFPRAIILATFIVLGLSVFGSLAIAAVVPPKEINLVSGVMQAFTLFLENFGVGYLSKLVALMLVLGSLAGLSAWLLGPLKGVFAARKDDFLPHFLLGENAAGMPVKMLIAQAVICSTLATVATLVLPNGDASYWALNVLAAIFAFLMYILVFMSARKLRCEDPNTTRPFKCGGSSHFMFYLIFSLGMLGCLSGLVLSFESPDGVHIETVEYISFLIGGFLFTMAPAFWMIARKQV